MNIVSFKQGLYFYLEKGQFFLNVHLGENRWGFGIMFQIHHHFMNFDKCFTINFGRWDGIFLKVCEIW